MSNLSNYINTTHLYLGVEEILTQDEKDRFLDKVFAAHPNLKGAHVADVIDIMSNHDMHLEYTEAMYEAHEERIAAIGAPKVATLCCYLALYLYGPRDEEFLWEHTLEFIERWEANRCGHVWYEAPQLNEAPDHGSRVTRTCTLDKNHIFPIDHHDRTAPNF
jgi:hypothetical protein